MKSTGKIFCTAVALFLLSVSCFTVSCKKEKILKSGGSVSFSADTLMFDTVFTQQGSATRSLIIYNNEDQKIHISSIRLKQGDSSPFRLNINGYPGKEIDDIEMAANDSLYVFAAVTIDPTNEDMPFVIEDSLIVTLNGNEFTIPVVAFGQNVHYIVDSVLQTQTWSTDKPYVIIHNALIDEGQTLTIPAGVRVYMHADSRLYVAGTLKINGTKADSVIFQGDRIDRNVLVGEYLDLTGEWGGLHFLSTSHDNEINYAIIKNGGAPLPFIDGSPIPGAMIRIDSLADNNQPKLKLTNTIIKNSNQFGILAFTGSLYMDNCLVTDCQYENIAFLLGGDYTVNNSTIANYGTGAYGFSKDPQHITAVVENYYYVSQTQYNAATLNFSMSNSIVYSNSGINDDEFFLDKKDDYPATFTIKYCLLKSSPSQPSFVTNNNCIFNQDPLFAGIDSANYHIGNDASPAIGTGVQTGIFSTDLDGVLRSNPPTIGCYEFVP